MKITPVAQGTGVPAASQTTSQSMPADKIARAKAIAAGEAPVEQEQQLTGDPQVDRINAKRIKMKTNASTNRHETQVQEPVQELATEPVKLDTNEPVASEVVEETKPLSPQFAALAKAKRALQVKERELSQREEALKTQSPAGNEELIAKLKSNPLNVLQEYGVTYEQLTEAIINNQNGITPEILSLQKEIKALKDDLNTQFVTRDQQAEAQVLADIDREVTALTAEGEEFGAIREARQQRAVTKLIHKVFKEGWPEKGLSAGTVMDTAHAAQIVEDQLVDEAIPFAKLSKVQKRLTPAQEVAVAQAAAQTPVPKPNTKVMRTLTNRDSALPVTDRRSRAIAAMLGTLKR